MSRVGKRLHLEIHGAQHMNGEWEIVVVDANDLHLPYLAKHESGDLQLWMTPRFVIGICQGHDHKITELN